MDFITQLILALGIYFLAIIIVWIITLILLVWFIVWMAKKHPYASITIAIIFIVIGVLLDIIAFETVVGLIAGTSSIITAIIGLIIANKKLKKALKKK